MKRLLASSAQIRAWPKWRRYVGASGLVLLAFGAQILMRDEVPPHLFPLYFPAVVAAAILFGGNPAAWSVTLGAGMTAYFLFQPRGFAVADPIDALALVLFVATALPLVFVMSEVLTEFDRRGREQKAAQEALAHATEADRLKDLLLQEMAHRTKNDLQFLSSMLQIEARALGDGDGRASLLSAASRIAVVGRVHSLLQRGGPPNVEMKPLIGDLCADLRISLVGLRPIAFRVEAESLLLPMDAARSTALIVNELATNALKHAFPDDRPGTVKIRLAREDDEIVLLVEDDGIGIPADTQQESGFGRKLVRALAQQLGGVVANGSGEAGARCELRFPAPPV
jgi:two-component sensor histidine kinase